MFTRQRLITLTAGVFACLMGCSPSQQPFRFTEVRPLSLDECPDFTGKYVIQGEDGQVQILITQSGCNQTIILRRDLGKATSEQHLLSLDGTVQQDSPWLGGTDRYETSAKFNQSSLQIEARTTTGRTLTMVYSPTPEGDLREEALINGRTGSSVVAKRQK